MSKTKYAQSQGLELLTQVVEDVGPIFNIDQARAAAPARGILPRRIPWLLSRLAAGGWIVRLKRGTYVAQSPLFSATIHPFAIAQALVEPLAISHWSALAHHGCTTQIPAMIQASTPRKVVTPQMRAGQAYSPRGRAVWSALDMEFEFIQVQPAHFFGFQQTWVDRWRRVAITDLERTLLDMLAHPHVFGSLQVGIETLETYLAQLNLEKLVGYALRYAVGAVIKRLGWILEALGVPEHLLDPLAAYPTSAYALLDRTGPPRGNAVSRWNLYNNLTPG